MSLYLFHLLLELGHLLHKLLHSLLFRTWLELHGRLRLHLLRLVVDLPGLVLQFLELVLQNLNLVLVARYVIFNLHDLQLQLLSFLVKLDVLLL